MFDDRYLVFELSGEECRPGVNISIQVEVVCDFGVSDNVEFDFATFVSILRVGISQNGVFSTDIWFVFC